VKLYVKYGKGKRRLAFHPRLKINTESGFCRNQWSEMHFEEGVYVGAQCVKVCSVAEVVERYFSELKRMGYTVEPEPTLIERYIPS
jgi:hypothetical protein